MTRTSAIPYAGSPSPYLPLAVCYTRSMKWTPWTAEPNSVEAAAHAHDHSEPFGWFALPQQDYSLTVTSPTALLLLNGTYGYAMEAEATINMAGNRDGGWRTCIWLLAEGTDLSTLQLAYYVKKAWEQANPDRATVVGPPKIWADVPDEEPREMEPGTRVLAILMDEGREARQLADVYALSG